ncbi:MarR family winged helix-turn-helix transcriptional regulator [Glutamicibacter endophyticus]|uniref:MarR family winged helix-turn-helix transcriptional regulator n=1 Tax=Glutamicibacter endophyticus TaxID=1522174 RepID=UPI003AF1B2AB
MDATASLPARSDLLDATEQELFALISITAKSRKHLAAALDERLPPSALPVLGMVMHASKISQSEICEHLMTDKASLSRLVARLEETEMIAREIDENDRRVVHLIPTDFARERWQDLSNQWRAKLRERISHWSDEDLDRLVHLMVRLNTDLRLL